MLVVSVLAAIGFSVSRVSLSGIKQSSRLEDSEIAYQAAEGGIEMGLLYYRYDRNSEVPSDISGGVSASTTEGMRYCVTTDTVINDHQTLNDTAGLDPTQSYFDLKMYHLNDGNTETAGLGSCNEERYKAGLCVATPDESLCTGDVSCYTASDGVKYLTPALAQDSVVEYNVAGAERLYLKWEYLEDVNAMTDEEKATVNLLYLPVKENGEINSYQKQLFPNIFNEIDIPLENINKIRLKPFGADLKSYSITVIDPGDYKMDSRYTIIESTGYYGSAKRKLRVKLDRATGTLLSPFDLLMYSAQ